MNNVFKSGRPIKSLPFSVYMATVVLLILAGLFTSIYLSISHYRVYTDMSYKSFCAISRAINCDTISQSPYAIFLNVPVPVWGVIGYLFALALLLFSRIQRVARDRMWSLLFWIFLAFSGYSIILALISTYLIHSYCIMCLLIYGINFALLWYSWLIHNRFSSSSLVQDTQRDISFFRRRALQNFLYFSPLLLLLLALLGFFPAYWNLGPPAVSAHVASGVTDDGHPWIGAENPHLVITEFTDYQCFQCKKMHFFLRQLITNNPGKIKLIHRHFPMDNKFNPVVKLSFHTGSGYMALLAIYAATKDRSWVMNDLLFEMAGDKTEIGLRELAQRTGLNFGNLKGALHDPRIRQRLVQDIHSGLKLGISATPAFIIEDRVFVGQIPADILKKALD